MPEKKKSAPEGARRARRAKLRRKRMLRRVICRSALSVLTVVALVLVALLWAGHVAFLGPSRTMGDLLTVTMLETSALKFVPRIYYSEEQVEEIVARNSVAEVDEEVNTSLISIGAPTPEPLEAPEQSLSPDATPTPEPTPTPLPTPKSGLEPIIDEDGIQIYELKGNTYHGYMTVVLDPSRVSVGTSSDNYGSGAGKQLNQIAKRYKAVAAINGGAFEDGGGVGNGGQPIGLVVSQGKLCHYASDGLVIGFTQDDILVFGYWTTQQAYNWKLRDAVAFGPALIYNGEPVAAKGAGSGLNPRTGIGQRADGAVLMLIIEGRNASSLGGTYADMIEVMLDFGAVNAANLDGGSSSMLYYKGDYVSNGVVLTGSRNLPTAFIVK